MKILIAAIAFLLICMVLYKMSVFNGLAAGGKKGYSYMCYSWSFDKARADSIIEYWNADAKRERVVRKLMFYDFIFVIIYVVLVCHFSYTLLQKQNRLWLNIWLRMGIFSILIAGALNLTQDYFNILSIYRGKSYGWVLIITLVKWVFVTLSLLPLILTLFLKPIKITFTSIK